MPSPFPQHLATIKRAKRAIDKAMAPLAAARQHTNEALAITSEMLFDHLCKHKDSSSLDKINQTAGIVGRLAESAVRLQSVEHKSREFEEQRAQLHAETRQAGLPPDVRERIEQELNLLG